MYVSQIAERKEFHYPPVARLIKITLKHVDEQVVGAAAAALAVSLRTAFTGLVLGPEAPLVSRVQNYFLQDFWVKLPKDSTLNAQKKKLQQILSEFQQQKAFKSVRVVVNVDA